jgi:acyl-CoA synthetase (AMP-forming)/AMP-acid ligase II
VHPGQIGAVLVPINYWLTPEDFVDIINHSGSSVVCAAADYLDAVDSTRDQLTGVRHFVAFGETHLPVLQLGVRSFAGSASAKAASAVGGMLAGADFIDRTAPRTLPAAACRRTRSRPAGCPRASRRGPQ